MRHRFTGAGMVALAALLAAGPAAAGTTLSDAVAAYILNTLFLLLCGALVMFMAAGFAMLEAGTVRGKSVTAICAKNVSLYALAGIAFYFVGYEVMYGTSVSGLFGIPDIWGADDAAALSGEDISGHASAADWFFQMVFVATAASVVSGGLAERVRFWPFALSTLVLAAAIYPVVGHWTWGGGWLYEIGFSDFAGSTIVHSVGGWVALTGIMVLGPRMGRFDAAGNPLAIAPTSMPYVTLGTFILWLGWFGFNGGSQLSFSSVDDAVAVANIFVNTNAAAAAGVVTMALASWLMRHKLDLPLMLNGALAGLVSITAEPSAPSVALALAIGSVGALIMMGAARLMERARLDDAVGAVPVHLAAGIWGTLAVALSNPDASFATQLIGVAAVALFVGGASWVVWKIIDAAMGARLRDADEQAGGDLAEFGLAAHNLG
ncbi:ammonium transporter [Pseudoruegeria sp. HB172150]|uniref:ammonium transporter n=1 Tax=Pseudoruegeria sp. HB172150 TaxID=2721164 RepID=UPI001553DDD8|nr:ammonium transporter [Pseudoruegeria sp. HB172150]